MSTLLLCLAIIFEVIGTTSIKISDGFTKLVPSVITGVSYIISFVLLSLSLKYGFEVGKAYAIWSGIGTLLITIIGIILFKESFTTSKVSGIVLIIIGVVVLNLFEAKK